MLKSRSFHAVISMINKLQISLESLKNNEIYKFKESVTHEDLDVIQEKELQFTKPVEITGKAYIVSDTLILNIDIRFYVLLPCSLCNELVEKELNIINLQITEKISEISSIYDYKEEIRNACFLEIPSYIQCNENCPEKTNIKKYLNIKKENYPFSNLKE